VLISLLVLLCVCWLALFSARYLVILLLLQYFFVLAAVRHSLLQDAFLNDRRRLPLRSFTRFRPLQDYVSHRSARPPALSKILTDRSNAVGDNGGKAAAFGIQSGSGNSQDDVTIFKQGTFGTTAKGQVIDPAKDLAALQALSGNTLPQVSAGGQLTITLHQNNGDGAGPMACFVDTAASGKFEKLTIVTDVPGNNGNSGANDQDFVSPAA
jgi:hypothetical protein